MTDTETDAMTDKSIQAWLDGELDKKPAVSESELTAYEKLYLALQEQPEERLAPGFAARVTARIQQVEDSRSARKANVLGMLLAVTGFVLLFLYTDGYNSLHLAPLAAVLRDLFLPVILFNQTWILTALILVVIAGLDKWLVSRRIQHHTN
jgi:hypothetical protein